MDERSPYAPPASDVMIFEERKGAAWKAVLIGLIVDHVGSLISGVILGAIIGKILVGDDGDTSRLMQLLDDPLSPLMLFFYTVGCLFSALGAYVCARIARQNELKLAVALAALSLLYGAIFHDQSTTLTFDVLLSSAGVASIFLGAWLGMRRNQRARAAA